MIVAVRSTPDVSVIVFAYNEASNVEFVLRQLAAWRVTQPWRMQIIFVDDGSKDGTAIVARRTLDELGTASDDDVVCSHTENRGIGAAIKTGVQRAEGRWVTFLPADGQIPPSAVGTLLTAARDQRAHLVLSLYPRRDDGLHRKLLSWGVRQMVAVTQGMRLRSDGPYLFERRLFVPQQLPTDSFCLNFEFPLRVQAAGLRVVHVEVPCLPRHSGQSKSARVAVVLRIAGDLVALRWRRNHKILCLWSRATSGN